MNTVVIIPARYASTRLPAKPLIDLCGKPMIQRVYEQAKKATVVNRVIVATDHEKIAECVKKFSGEVILTPATLTSGSDRIAFVAEKLPEAEIIVNVQGDEPLIAPRMIDEAVSPLLRDSECKIQVATIVKKISSPDELQNPNVVKVVLDSEGYAIYFSRSAIPYLRDTLEIREWHKHHTYYKHFGLYVFRKNFLLQFTRWGESTLERIEKLEQLRIIDHGFKIKTTVSAYESIPVDTAGDADRVRKILHRTKGGNV